MDMVKTVAHTAVLNQSDVSGEVKYWYGRVKYRDVQVRSSKVSLKYGDGRV